MLMLRWLLLRNHHQVASPAPCIRVLDVQLLQLVLDLIRLQVLEGLQLGSKVRGCRGTGLGEGVTELVPPQSLGHHLALTLVNDVTLEGGGGGGGGGEEGIHNVL